MKTFLLTLVVFMGSTLFISEENSKQNLMGAYAASKYHRENEILQ